MKSKSVKRINIEQIIARKDKGWAFGPGTHEEREARHAKVANKIQKDFETMSEADFRTKYENYIY